jgi:hypothetical protein
MAKKSWVDKAGGDGRLVRRRQSIPTGKKVCTYREDGLPGAPDWNKKFQSGHV